MPVDVERVTMEAASKPQPRWTQTKKYMATALITIKILILIFTVAMLCVSAILPEGVTWEHIWCEGEPNKNCAGFMQFPIIFSGVMVVVAVSSIIAIACDWSHPVVIWVDVAVSIAAGLIWIALAVVVVSKSIKVKLVRSGYDGVSTTTDKYGHGDASGLVIVPRQWLALGISSGITGFMLHLLDAMYRIRQYFVLRLVNAKPTPWAPPPEVDG